MDLDQCRSTDAATQRASRPLSTQPSRSSAPGPIDNYPGGNLLHCDSRLQGALPIPDSCSAAQFGNETRVALFRCGFYFAKGWPARSSEGTLMAVHASTRTTQLYDQRKDRVALD